MKFIVPMSVAVCALGITLSAQDTDVKARTKINADEGQVVTMVGCLRTDTSTGRYSLTGHITGNGDDLKVKSKVTAENEKSGTTLKTETRTSGDQRTVATGGAMSTFDVWPRSKVDLAPYVGHEVQLSTVIADPKHHDADVKIKDKATVDPAQGRDAASRSKSRIEVGHNTYSVISVKPLGGACTQ